MGKAIANDFVLEQPSVQMFEKKPKTEAIELPKILPSETLGKLIQHFPVMRSTQNLLKD
jgi:ubiquinone biosynthesis protein Coq4